MRIAFITAGAAGMYCGSCLRDNTLARTLMSRGHEVLLVPTYTSTRTDEPNVSVPHVFLGGINVYLQHRWAVFRHTPGFVDRWLDAPRLLDWASGLALKTDAEELGSLTVSMLRGAHGPDAKEFARLVEWLAGEMRPDVVDLSNSLLLGLAEPLRQRLGRPVVCTLSGEDVFLEGLGEPWRTECLELLQQHAVHANAFITFSRYYAGFMAEYLKIPDAKLHCVPLGISLEGHGQESGVRGQDSGVGCAGSGAKSDAEHPEQQSGERQAAGELVLGYLARICPEKGLHLLCEAFRLLREQPKYARTKLRVAGYLGQRDRPYWQQLQRHIADCGLNDAVEYVGEVDRAGKIRFLQSLDVFSVPTVYRESKGLPVLEAWANRVPVVQPWHGVFPELSNATQGAVLVPPNDPHALADAIGQLFDNEPLRRELGRRGRAAVEQHFTAERMAEATIAVYRAVTSAALPHDG